MSNQRFESTSKVVALDPVCHKPTVTGTGSNGIGSVDVRDVGGDVVECLDEISVRCTAPVRLDFIGKILAIAVCSGELSGGDNKALFGPKSKIPTCAPCIALGKLWTTVDDESMRILFAWIEVGG